MEGNNANNNTNENKSAAKEQLLGQFETLEDNIYSIANKASAIVLARQAEDQQRTTSPTTSQPESAENVSATESRDTVATEELSTSTPNEGESQKSSSPIKSSQTSSSNNNDSESVKAEKEKILLKEILNAAKGMLSLCDDIKLSQLWEANSLFLFFYVANEVNSTVIVVYDYARLVDSDRHARLEESTNRLIKRLDHISSVVAFIKGSMTL